MLRMNIPELDGKTSEILDILHDFETRRGGGPGVAGGFRPAKPREGPGKSMPNIFRTREWTKSLKARIERLSYERSYTLADVEAWLSEEGDYGKALRVAIPGQALISLKELLRGKAGTVRWPLFVSIATL